MQRRTLLLLIMLYSDRSYMELRLGSELRGNAQNVDVRRYDNPICMFHIGETNLPQNQTLMDTVRVQFNDSFFTPDVARNSRIQIVRLGPTCFREFAFCKATNFDCG